MRPGVYSSPRCRGGEPTVGVRLGLSRLPACDAITNPSPHGCLEEYPPGCGAREERRPRRGRQRNRAWASVLDLKTPPMRAAVIFWKAHDFMGFGQFDLVRVLNAAVRSLTRASIR